MSDQEDKEIINRVRKELNQNIDQLDPDISRRLHRARALAMEQAKDKQKWFQRLSPVIALESSFVMAITFTLVILLSNLNTQIRFNENDFILQGNKNAAAHSLEMLATDESLEFYDQIDFYQWLTENDAKNAG